MNTTSTERRPSLDITAGAMGAILRTAEKAGSDECMGLLASPAGRGPVTHSCALEAEASAAHAEAAPLELKRAAAELRKLGLVPRGIWHSHGFGRPFHSGTDHETVRTLLPGMAGWNCERPAAPVAVPAVTAPDAAVLPLPDGRVQHITLHGPWLEELGAYGAAQWAGISFAFGAKERRTVVQDDHVLLEGAGVSLKLTIPEGAAVEFSKADPAAMRIAKLYSLVVNAEGEACAERLVMFESGGETVFQEQECEVWLVELDGERARVQLKSPRRGLLRFARG